MKDRVRAYNPDIQPDPQFLALKQAIQAGTLNRPIHWNEVFDFDAASFRTPEEAAIIRQVMDDLVATDYGQRLFRDVVLNEARIAPVKVKSRDSDDKTMSVSLISPGAYSPAKDAIIFNFEAYDIFEAFAPEMAALLAPKYAFIHEADHAVRFYGDEMFVRDSYADLKHTACLEQHAMARANEVRVLDGVDIREEYAFLDTELELRLMLMRQFPPAARVAMVQGISDFLKTSVVLNSGCSKYSEHQANYDAQTLFEEVKERIEAEFPELSVEGDDGLLSNPPFLTPTVQGEKPFEIRM